MMRNHRLHLVCFIGAIWTIPSSSEAQLAGPAFSVGVEVARATQQLLQELPENQRADLEDLLLRSAENAKATATKSSKEAENISKNSRAPTELKQLAIGAKEEQAKSEEKRSEGYLKAATIVRDQNIPDPSIEANLTALESILIASSPTLPICGGKLNFRGDPFQVTWQSTMDDFLSRFGEKLNAIGRIEMVTETYILGPNNVPVKKKVITPVGTGFAISDRHVFTAGHVADIFWEKNQNKLKPKVIGLFFNTGGEYDFECTEANKTAVRTAISSVVKMNWDKDVNGLDYAVLKISDTEAPMASKLNFAKGVKYSLGDFLIVIGYPGDDSRIDATLKRSMMQIPANGGLYPIYDVKRIAPGSIMPKCLNAGSIHLSHNATTLNRNSGSPILLASTGELVGMQVQGIGDFSIGVGYCNLGITQQAIQNISGLQEATSLMAERVAQ